MLLRTHFAISVFAILIFISSVESKLVFVLITLFATLLPDIDSRFSTIGRRKVARILQFFTRHRGVIHSYTFLLVLTFILILIWPVLGFGFFLGYSLHLFADSFTIEGIKPFHPSKYKSKGFIKTGGKSEMVFFLVFVFLSAILLLLKVL
ncbi:metal-dependent hydrolase [archaeon]|jgi:inner membrane protein|nr:metal-dependent hydrolase [archaeon]